VKKAVQGIVEKVRSLLPKDSGAAKSPFQKLVDEIEKGIGKAAQEAQKVAEQAKKTFDEARQKYEALKGDFDQLKEFLADANAAKEHGEKAYAKDEDLLETCKQALEKVKKHDLDGAKQDAEQAKKLFGEARAETDACEQAAEKAKDEVPERVREAVQVIAAKVKAMLRKVAGDPKSDKPDEDSILAAPSNGSRSRSAGWPRKPGSGRSGEAESGRGEAVLRCAQGRDRRAQEFAQDAQARRSMARRRTSRRRTRWRRKGSPGPDPDQQDQAEPGRSSTMRRRACRPRRRKPRHVRLRRRRHTAPCPSQCGSR